MADDVAKWKDDVARVREQLFGFRVQTRPGRPVIVRGSLLEAERAHKEREAAERMERRLEVLGSLEGDDE